MLEGFVIFISYNGEVNIEYFMESARVRCLHTSCDISEIERVSEANEWDFWYKTSV